MGVPGRRTGRWRASRCRRAATARSTAWELYEKGALARAEEDTNGDGKLDKWETYRAGALASVAMDTDHDGRPDRRLTYGPDGVKAEKLQ